MGCPVAASQTRAVLSATGGDDAVRTVGAERGVDHLALVLQRR